MPLDPAAALTARAHEVTARLAALDAEDAGPDRPGPPPSAAPDADPDPRPDTAAAPPTRAAGSGTRTSTEPEQRRPGADGHP